MEAKIVYVVLLLVAVCCTVHSQSSRRHEGTIMETVEYVLQAHRHIHGISIFMYSDEFSDSGHHYNYDHVNKRLNKDPRSAQATHCAGDITRGLSALLVQVLLTRQTDTDYTWETPIQEILGHKLVLPDMHRSENINLKDVFSMRTGLNGMDIVPLVRPYDSNTLFRKLRYLQEDAGFRSQAIDNNVLFTLVDRVVEKLSGLDFDEAMQQYLMQPLEITKKDYRWDTPVTVNSRPSLVQSTSTLCLHDDAVHNVFRFLAKEGMVRDNNRFLEPRDIEEVFRGVQGRGTGDVDESGFQASDDDRFQGLSLDMNTRGWILGRLGTAHRTVTLSGSIPGQDQSLLTYLPDQKIGILISFRGDGGSREDFAAKFLLTERLLRLELAQFQDSGRVGGSFTKKAFDTMRRPPAQRDGYTVNEACLNPSVACGLQRPLEDYAGLYKNYAYGEVNVTYNFNNETGKVKENLSMQYGDALFSLTPVASDNDTFVLTTMPQGTSFYTAHATLHRVKMMATFRAYHDDPETQIFSFTVSGFDRSGDVEFSLNPREPAYEREDRETEEEVPGCGAGCLLASLWGTVLAVFVRSMVHF